MDNQESQFNKARSVLKGARLSDTQKKLMLDGIYRHTDLSAPAVRSPFIFSMFFERRYMVAVAILLFMVTSTTYASAASVPGDPLYAVKVKVVEPVALALRVDEHSKNEYLVSLLQRRVDELQTLKDEGRLNPDLENISATVAQKTLMEIETSAVFNDAGTNLEVSGHIETYNAMVDEPHRLRTVMSGRPLKDTKDGKDEDDEASKGVTSDIDPPVEKILEVVEPVTGGASDAVSKPVEELEGVVDPAVPETLETDL